MFKGFNIKKIITWILSAILIYFILIVVFQIISYANKSSVEKALGAYLKNGSVKIGGILNIPFISIHLFDIHSESEDYSITVKSADIYYNPLGIFTGSPATAIYHAVLKKISFRGDPEAFKKFETAGLDERRPEAAPLDLTLSGNEMYISLQSGGGIETDFYLDRFNLKVNNDNIDLAAFVNAQVHAGLSTGLISSDLKLDFKYSLSEKNGSGKVHFRDINAGGFSVISNEDAYFNINKTISVDLERSFPSKKIRMENGSVYYTLEKDVNLEYMDEYYLFEHIFNRGSFHYSLSYFTDRNKWGFDIILNSSTNKEGFLLKVSSDAGGKWNITGSIKSVKYGNGNADLNIDAGDVLPYGFASLDNFTIIPGLLVSGSFNLEKTAKDKLVITGEKAELNGGPIGSVYTEADVISNGIKFSSMQSLYNGSMNGYVTNGRYDLFVYARDVSGLAVVSNTGFDILGISSGRYSGMMHVFPDRSNNFSLTAQVDAGGISAGLAYSRNFLSFRNVKFADYSLSSDFDLSFKGTNKNDTAVFLSGMAKYRDKYSLPMKGTVLISGISSAVDTEIFIDRDIKIAIKYLNDISALSVSAVQYPLTHVGLEGSISFEYNDSIYMDKILSMSLKSAYDARGRAVIVDFNSTRQDSYLSIDHFLIDTKDDRVLGHGKLYQQGNQLYGQVDFDRGGSLFVSSWPGNYYAMLQVRNFKIKDIIKDTLDVLVSGKIIFSGDSSSSRVSGSLNAVNSENSKSFYLNIPEIKKEGNIWSFNNIDLLYGDIKAGLNLNINVSDPDYSIDAKGKISYDDNLKAEGSLSYYCKTSGQDVFYDLASLTISGRTLYGITGDIEIKGNSIAFNDSDGRGLHGYYKSAGVLKNWKVAFKNKNIQAGYSGTISNNIIKADFSLGTPLDILSSLGFMKDIKGDCGILLSFNGNMNSPVMKGEVEFKHAFAEFSDLGLKLKDFNTVISITSNRMILTNIFLYAGADDFMLEGTADFKSLFNPYLDITVMSHKKIPAVPVNIIEPDYKITGNISINNLKLTGELGSLTVTGDMTVNNFLIYLSSLGGNSSTNTNKVPAMSIFNNIRWNLPLHIGSGVKFSNEFIDVFLKKNNILAVGGSLSDKSLSIKGNVEVDRGTLVYLGKDFTVNNGKAIFSGNPGDPLPYVNLESSTKYQDSAGTWVEVFLTFTGKADNLTLGTLSSSPPKSKGELSAVLGLQSQNEEATVSNSGPQSGGFIPAGVSSAAENVFIFNPLTVDLRRRLGLDMFMIRTGVIDTWARKTIFGESTLSTADMFEGSTISVGKYIIPDVFIQYDLIISRNPLDVNSLIPLQTFGLDFDMKLFDLGMKFQPYTEFGRPVLYEPFIEMNFNQKF